MRKVAVLAVAALIATGAGVAAAQSAANAGATIKERQEHMKAMGGAMRTLTNYVQKKDGATLEDAKKAAATLNERAGGPVWTLFPAGSTSADSAAKPEIWSQEAQFKKAADDLKQASAQLVQVASSGQEAQIGPAIQATGKACGTCHETFRAKKN